MKKNKQKKFRKSSSIKLGLVVSVAALLSGCGDDTVKSCVEVKSGLYVSSDSCEQCEQEAKLHANDSAYHYHALGYRWYYLPHGNSMPYYGTHANGGSYFASAVSSPSGHSSGIGSFISRGGFGSTGGGHGGS